MENDDKLKLSSEEEKVLALRCIQDIVAKNRDNSLFIPKKVRNDYLKNGNSYYKVLDEVKNKFWDINDLEKPIHDTDFQIYTDKNDNETVTLKQVHDELIIILKGIKDVLDEANISFMLDGGTLIGACREDADFLSWDDDVDISIKSKDADKVFSILKDKLSDEYDIQDYDSEEFYSPRLSRMRVRQKTTRSIVDEKDSELYEKYNMRGLFVDVYAYTPILYNLTLDKLYRYLFIHPLYKKSEKLNLTGNIRISRISIWTILSNIKSYI